MTLTTVRLSGEVTCDHEDGCDAALRVFASTTDGLRRDARKHGWYEHVGIDQRTGCGRTTHMCPEHHPRVGAELAMSYIRWVPEDGVEPTVPWGSLTGDEQAQLLDRARRYVADAERNPDALGGKPAGRAQALLALFGRDLP